MTAKVLDAAIAAHIATGQHTLAWAVEIVRPDATAFRFCSASRAATISGDVYTPIDGFSLSSIASTVGLNVDNGKFTLGDSEDLLREDVYDGVWDDSTYRLFQYNWASPSDGVITWPHGTLANAEPRIGAYDMEFRDWRQALQQDNTRLHEEACSYTLGHATTCRKDLTTFTDAGVALTGVTSARVVTASGYARAADFATEGRLLFTTGANANGVWRQIQSQAGGGVITLTRPLPRTPLIGDLFTIVAGCRHRFDEDCVTKFSNAANNGGCNTKPSRSDIVNGELAP